MAEIHIQKKKPPVWPWLILIVVIIIAAWLLIENTLENDREIAGGIVRDEVTEDQYRDDELSDTSHASVVIHDYIVYINDEQSAENADNEEFIKEGVRKLGNALSAVVRVKYPRDSELKNKTEFIQQKSDSISHFANNSGEIKKIFVSTVEVMNSMKEKTNQEIDGEITKAKESAERIKSNQTLKNQQKEMIVFLKKSGDVLQIIAADKQNNNKIY